MENLIVTFNLANLLIIGHYLRTINQGLKKTDRIQIILAHDEIRFTKKLCILTSIFGVAESLTYPNITVGFFATIILVGILGAWNLFTIQPKLENKFEEGIEEASAIVFRTVVEKNKKIWMAVVKMQTDWPPVRIEIGTSADFHELANAPKQLIREIESAIMSGVFKPAPNATQNLASAGVNHLIDIEGSSVNTIIREFLQPIIPTDSIQNPKKINPWKPKT